MFSGWVRYLQLTAKAKTGLGRSVIALGAVATICVFTAFAFLVVAVFIAAADLWGNFVAALAMGGFFLLAAIVTSLLGVMAQRRAAERARLTLQARSGSPWFDPKMLSLGLQIGRSIGLRKIVPLIAVGLLAATVAKEWFGPGRNGRDDDEDAAEDDIQT